MGQLVQTTNATPSTPPTGSAALYWKSDGLMYWKDDAGVEHIAVSATTALTSGRVPYATTGGALIDAANLTFNGTTLTAHTLTVSTGAFSAQAGTFATTLGVAGDFAINTNKFTVTASTGDTALAGNLTVSNSASGGTIQGFIKNTSNTASSDARLIIQTGGTSAGYAYLGFYDGASLLNIGLAAGGSQLAFGPNLASPAFAITTSGNITATGNLVAEGTGPHAIGGATVSTANLTLTGGFAGNQIGVYNTQTISPPVSGDAYGVLVAPTLNKQSSGTHSDFAGMRLSAPTIGAGAAALTNATTLKVDGAPSVGTNQRALWVTGGLSQFDGNIVVSGTGSHAIGTATTFSNTKLHLGGTIPSSSSGAQFALFCDPTGNPSAGDASYGIYISPTLNKAGSGTHSDFAALYVGAPTIGAGAATLTNATTLKIDGAPSVGTNQRALWVTAGDSQFDGLLKANGSITIPDAGIVAFGGVTNTYLQGSDGSDYMQFVVNGNTNLTVSSTAITANVDIVFGATTSNIRANTSDGSDTHNVNIGGGGNISADRGGYIQLFGNEHASSGGITAVVGTAATGVFQLVSSNATRAYLYNLHASDPFGWIVQYSNTAPNDTTHEFFYGVDNAAARAVIRSNGGLANYQANDVNLSDASVKTDIRGVDIAKLWDAHKRMNWVTYKYIDQTHDDPNIGYTAQGAAEAFKDVAPWIVDEWEPGKPGSPLAVYSGDLNNASGAVLTQAQIEIDELKAWKAKAEAALAAQGITIH